jgi:hypothetical protein
MRGSANQGKNFARSKDRRKNFGGGNRQVQFKTLFFFRPVCFGTVGCGVLPHPAWLDSLNSAGTSLLDYKRGVPVARPHGGRESRKRKDLHITTTTSRCFANVMATTSRLVSHVTATTSKGYVHVTAITSGPHSATDTFASANDTRPNIVLFSSQIFLSVLRNCRVRGCPTRRGWTTCPARARPSWIIRGACPFHDLEEV